MSPWNLARERVRRVDGSGWCFLSDLLLIGDIVGVFVGNKPIAGQKISGVITRSTSAQISVVFDDLPDSINLSTHN